MVWIAGTTAVKFPPEIKDNAEVFGIDAYGDLGIWLHVVYNTSSWAQLMLFRKSKKPRHVYNNNAHTDTARQHQQATKRSEQTWKQEERKIKTRSGEAIG